VELVALDTIHLILELVRAVLVVQTAHSQVVLLEAQMVDYMVVAQVLKAVMARHTQELLVQ
jgi:hypothetical protein